MNIPRVAAFSALGALAFTGILTLFSALTYFDNRSSQVDAREVALLLKEISTTIQDSEQHTSINRDEHLTTEMLTTPIKSEPIKTTTNSKHSSGGIGSVLAACMFLASETYNVPPAVLLGIFLVKGGRIGDVYKGDNNNEEYGSMKIPSAYLPELALKWKVSEDTAKKMLTDDPCTNIGVAAWIIDNGKQTRGTLEKAIAQYEGGTNGENLAFKNQVLAEMKKYGLLY